MFSKKLSFQVWKKHQDRENYLGLVEKSCKRHNLLHQMKSTLSFAETCTVLKKKMLLV